MDKFLDLIEKHNPETLNDEEMARSVTALYQDWLVWCASRLTVPKPKSALMAEFVNVSVTRNHGAYEARF